ncbi:MAG: hypothetical protein C0605_13000 [Hyphomicrobiales bacterium]|nr:MAG: hypothetical protein C0605_13000 [Hyphomicrobiales bacterium]
MNATAFFTKDDGRKLPVGDDYLLPFLNPTSPGTNYWDSPPPNSKSVLRRQDGRILLQLHQVIDLLRRSQIPLKDKVLLDIGTGNGMIPRLMLQFSDLSAAVGVDPYLDGEHKSSWQQHDRDELFLELAGFIEKQCPGVLDFDKYRDLTQYQDFSLMPGPCPYEKAKGKKFRFEQIGAHDLGQLDDKFDIFYAKAIDHIPNWAGIFKAIREVANPGAVVVIKHFSFFSYLGPHRYATTNIPWGHLLMTDDEYRRFATEFHSSRSDQMIDFYFNGLAYPRTTMSQLTEIARQNGFAMHVSITEPNRSLAHYFKFIDEVPDFWDIVRENHPSASVEEMFSGRCHMVFKSVD